MNAFSEFIKIIEEFIELFDSLIPVEQAKLDAAVKNRASFVDECVNKEQAFVLRLRGLEQKREAAQEHLGMKGYTFRQILEHAPGEVAAVLQPLFDRLSEQIRTFQSINENAKAAIEVNLHMIQEALASNVPGQDLYSANGSKKSNNNNGHFTSRSV